MRQTNVIEGPNGKIYEVVDQMVNVPLDDFEGFLEDFENLEDIAAIKASDALGGVDMPADIVKSLLDGKHPIAVYRAWRSLTQEELASKVNTGKIYISQIENKRRNPGKDLTQKLARVLEVDAEDITDWL